MVKNRVRLNLGTIRELKELLSLGDESLRRHSVGKLIREDFKARGWLKNRPRGKPDIKNFEKKDTDLKIVDKFYD